MPFDPAFGSPGSFFKGNIHTHSNRSDGALTPEEVCRRYREAGYDFLALTDHFLPKFGFPIVDTEPFRTAGFTTILGAEVHAPKTALGEVWHILAVGLPADFPPTSPDESGAALAQRCVDAGAFVAIPHPGWYALTADDAATLPTAHAVEIYNHTSHVRTDRGDGAYLVDQMLVAGRKINLCATDDAHFHCDDAFGGFVMVKAVANTPYELLAALKAGAFYSSQGPTIEQVTIADDTVEIVCSPCQAIMALGRGSLAEQQIGTGLTRAQLPLGKLRRGGFIRIAIADATGRRAWTNPVWL
ncbi:PHP domain-containing protein [Rhabdaerophilum sp. SD176]|uniref:PHP domain-containing protein n=1 Tax=Rhabdaerophilum sp. SD176 TaxID=2983548 RepID=UPI0024DFB5C5|nr:PHP domain-containing protein [Rhabdaerophilum sp. SD176]